MATVDDNPSARPSYPGSGSSFESFLQLPREIRTIIYSHIVHGLVLAINEPLSKTPETAILRCNCLVRQEAIQLVYFRVSRQDFYDLVLAVPRTVLRLSQLQDLAQIRNIVVTSFEVNKVLYDASGLGSCDPRPSISLPGLRKVQVELEVCSCGLTHFSVRRRSCAQVQRGQEVEAADLHCDKSYTAKTILRNLNKLGEQVQWMRNVKGYEVAIKLVMMDNKGQESKPGLQSAMKKETSDGKCNRIQVAVLMITRREVKIIQGEDDIAEEGRKLLIEYLELGRPAKI